MSQVTDDGLYSDDAEEEEGTGAVSYAEVEALCQVQDTGEFEKQSFHPQAVARAANTGQLTEGELQAYFSGRAERDQEKQWALADAQRGLVQMGSPVAAEDFVTGVQRLANKMTQEAMDQQ